MLDLVIENGRLVDGTGNPWFFGDVGIKDGTIVEVGRVNQRGLEAILDTATYEDPKHFPEGISHVLVNGTKAVVSGALLGTGEGTVIGRSIHWWRRYK